MLETKWLCFVWGRDAVLNLKLICVTQEGCKARKGKRDSFALTGKEEITKGHRDSDYLCLPFIDENMAVKRKQCL